MNIETMRKLDYYLGVPLCFLGTAVSRISTLLARDAYPEKPKNVLFIQLSEMGSTILADPALQKVKCALNADVYYAIFDKNSHSLKLLETVPHVNIFIFTDRSFLGIVSGAIRFLFWVRKKHIDTIVDLELFSRFTALLTGFSGARRRVGFDKFYQEGLYRGDFLTHKVAYNPHLHIAKNFISLANALLSTKPEIPYSKTVITDEEITLRKVVIADTAKERMRQRIQEACPSYRSSRHSVVLFNANSSDLMPLRRWPQEYFVRLAKIVLERYPDVIILLTGDSSENAEQEIIRKAVDHDRCANFAGFTSIRDLPALYSVSSFMLTNDSGPAQFASVTEMPAYVLFGPETPKLYGPLGKMTPIYAGLSCSPCIAAANHRKSACISNVCLQVIMPDLVMDVLKPRLEAAKGTCQ